MKSKLAFLAISALLTFNSCQEFDFSQIPNPSEQFTNLPQIEDNSNKVFVLVHGAWHGAWCWEEVVPLLESRGTDQVIALDLPGHGEDNTESKYVTLASYGEAICEVLSEIDEDKEVILVGHSLGGMAISAAAEGCSNRIDRLVYLAAFLPRDGESLLAIDGRNPRPTVGAALFPTPGDQYSLSVNPEMARGLFYGDLDQEDYEAAVDRLEPQAIAPLATPIHLTRANFGSIRKFYIETIFDGAVSIELQRDMQQASGQIKKVYTLNTSHSPFYSAPEELTAKILAASHYDN